MLRLISPKRMLHIAAAGALLTIANLPSANAAICYKGGSNGVVGGGSKSGVLKKNAEKRARGSWNSMAQSLMGSSRANWGNAQGRYYYCHHSFVWHCTAYARPCM